MLERYFVVKQHQVIVLQSNTILYFWLNLTFLQIFCNHLNKQALPQFFSIVTPQKEGMSTWSCSSLICFMEIIKTPEAKF